MTVLALMTDDEIASYGADADSCFGALETARGVLPLVALRVRARVSGVVAATEVVQTFANTTGVAIEATYIFPLPDRAAVHRFRMEVGGRVVEGVVDERGAARAEYDQAIAAGHRAAIAEEERPGVFTLRVGNLLPNERATVTLSLVGPLPLDDGEVTFRFPLVVAPRYISGNTLVGDQAGLGVGTDTDLVPDASRITPPVRLPGMPNPVQLAIEVAFDRVPGGIASSLHAIVDNGRCIHVQPGERLDRDFILRWRADGDELRSQLVCADDADGRGGTFMLTLVPPSTRAAAQKPRDVVIVLDRSGSMGGWKMVAARRAAARLIDSLTSRDRFCALAFDESVEAIPSAALTEATDRVRFRAIEKLAAVDARGGTELADPLKLALGMLAGGYDDRERVVVLVTDGQVGNEDHLLRELGANVKNVRVFTLGIDQAVNAAFLRRLAAAGAGACELVESEDRLDGVMAKFHRRIGAPIATELALSASKLEIDRTALAPARVPDVYAGAPVVVLGRYVGAAPADAALELAGTSFGDVFRERVARTGDGEDASWLGASWARARIRDLEDRYAAGEHQHERAIVEVSKRFGVLSRFTAFLAVDRSEVANRGGRIAQVVQQVESPADWDMMAAPSGYAAKPAPPPMPSKTVMLGRGGMATRNRSAAVASAGSMAAPPSPPMMMPAPAPAAPKLKSEQAESRAATIPIEPYVEALGKLARELATATGTTALRVARQRLTEWLEDARAMGLAELVAAVEAIALRLKTTLDEATARAVAAELEAFVQGGGGQPPKKSRLAFWK